MTTPSSSQIALCRQHGVEPFPVADDAKLGIALNVREGVIPINGLRHPPEEGTTGWFIWAGEELKADEDFFKPLHAAHVDRWCPTVSRFLALPPGWRFLVAGDYEDVWYDPTLLDL